MTELQVIARYTISAGQQETVLALLSKVAEASRAEPGNLAYDIYRAVQDDRLAGWTGRGAERRGRETWTGGKHTARSG